MKLHIRILLSPISLSAVSRSCSRRPLRAELDQLLYLFRTVLPLARRPHRPALLRAQHHGLKNQMSVMHHAGKGFLPHLLRRIIPMVSLKRLLVLFQPFQ